MPTETHEVPRTIVLVVDDEHDNLQLVARTLRNDFDVRTAASGDEALEILAGSPVDIILADQRMPEMSGVEFLRKAAGQSPDSKRLLMTAYTDTESLIEAINEGKVHYYIRKPWDPGKLHQTLTELARLRVLEDQNSRLLLQLQSANRDLALREGLLQKDLDERGRELLATVDRLKNANEALSDLVYRDGLTGLYNHRCFQERLLEETARSIRYGRPCSLIFIDVDHFKAFNDRFGHPLGDEALKSLSRILLGDPSTMVRARQMDIPARYGGEELVLLLPETSRAGAMVKADRIREAAELLRFPKHLDARLTLSAGVAECPGDATTAQDLLHKADEALYQAKHQGRNQVIGYGEWIALSTPKPARLKPYWFYLQEARRILETHRSLMVLHVMLEDLGRIEREYGHTVHRQVMDGLAEDIRNLPSSVLRSTDIVSLPEGSELGFVVFLDGPRSEGKESEAHSPEGLIARLTDHIEKVAHKHISGLVGPRLRVSVGHAVGIQTRRYAPERQIALLAHAAALSAKTAHCHRLEKEKLGLQSILLTGALSAVYQPIVHTATLQVAGYEALIRGPPSSLYETPGLLFESAGIADLEWELDQACLKTGLLASTHLPGHMYLSVNVLPSTLHDEAFATEELPRLVHQAGLTPARVTIEVTEQSAISNLVRFREALAPLRERGFRIALDDVGVAHANLEHIYELRPDVIKLDRSIVNDAFGSPVRRDLIASVLTLANRLEAALVAEGVERREDWECLRDMGVPFAQGYLFARPGPAFPTLVFPEKADAG